MCWKKLVKLPDIKFQRFWNCRMLVDRQTSLIFANSFRTRQEINKVVINMYYKSHIYVWIWAIYFRIFSEKQSPCSTNFRIQELKYLSSTNIIFFCNRGILPIAHRRVPVLTEILLIAFRPCVCLYVRVKQLQNCYMKLQAIWNWRVLLNFMIHSNLNYNWTTTDTSHEHYMRLWAHLDHNLTNICRRNTCS
jgi:hypothetical protein